jgi:hypothetical protein
VAETSTQVIIVLPAAPVAAWCAGAPQARWTAGTPQVTWIA